MTEAPTPRMQSDGSSPHRDLRAELDQFEILLNDLKVRFEQFFSGLVPLPPDKIHADLKRILRQLRKSPFKSSALGYRLRTLEHRYNTFNTYWQRVLREREEGVYVRDVFKAELRERVAVEEKRAQTAKGASERHMASLFNSYKTALEKETGKRQNLDFGAFQQSILNRVKDLKEKHGAKKFTFKVVVQDGKVSLKAKVKE